VRLQVDNFPMLGHASCPQHRCRQPLCVPASTRDNHEVAGGKVFEASVVKSASMFSKSSHREQRMPPYVVNPDLLTARY
jgi:hypothetical protein